jgi:hypothetical protein
LDTHGCCAPAVDLFTATPTRSNLLRTLRPRCRIASARSKPGERVVAARFGRDGGSYVMAMTIMPDHWVSRKAGARFPGDDIDAKPDGLSTHGT